MYPWFKALSLLLPPVFWFTSCASSSSPVSVPVAGGQAVAPEREGTGFKRAENDRIIVTDSALQAVNLNGNSYLRWRFAISPKQAAVLSSLRIEDVSDPAPFLLINDVAPQLDAGQWTEIGGLMESSSSSLRWLADPKETVRVFRFTASEPDGQSYVLYQAVQFTPASKEAIRTMVR